MATVGQNPGPLGMVGHNLPSLKPYAESWGDKAREKLRQMSTPGWQFFRKILIFVILIMVFGGIYQAMIGNNPEEWSHPTKEDGGSIINGFYVSTVVNSTVGYGDYYPYSHRGIILVIFNILISWILFSTVLG